MKMNNILYRAYPVEISIFLPKLAQLQFSHQLGSSKAKWKFRHLWLPFTVFKIKFNMAIFPLFTLEDLHINIYLSYYLPIGKKDTIIDENCNESLHIITFVILFPHHHFFFSMKVFHSQLKYYSDSDGQEYFVLCQFK